MRFYSKPPQSEPNNRDHYAKCHAYLDRLQAVKTGERAFLFFPAASAALFSTGWRSRCRSRSTVPTRCFSCSIPPFFPALMPLSVLIGITLSMLLRGRLILTLLLTGAIVLCLFWLVFSFLTGW